MSPLWAGRHDASQDAGTLFHSRTFGIPIMKSALSAILTAIFLLSSAGCAVNAATGRSQLSLVSQDKEISMGAQAAPGMIKESGGEIPSQEIQAYVRQLGSQLAAKSERPNLPWEFHVLNTDVVNAFALPGGKVFVTRGILSRMNSEAELAGVLGHEVGHVTARHFNDRMNAQIGAAVLAAGGMVAAATSKNNWVKVAGVGAAAGSGMVVLKFSRDEESEADALGVRYMTRLGYNPTAQIQVMQMLEKVAGNSDAVSALFQTHPNPAARIADLNALIPKQFPDYNQPGKYRFEERRFKTEVLDRLRQLPSLQNGKTAFMEPVEFEARYGMTVAEAARMDAADEGMQTL